MRHHIYADHDTYPTGILVKSSSFNLPELKSYYVDALEKQGIDREELIMVGLPYNDNNKAPVGFIKTQLETLLSGLDTLGVKRVLCCDAAYFKVLTKKTKAEVHLGYVLPCAIEGYEHIEIVLGVNQKSVMYDPKNQSKLQMALGTLASLVHHGHVVVPGTDLGTGLMYFRGDEPTKDALSELHQYPVLTADIEGFSLRFEKAGIGTITFCWNEQEGIVFPVDYQPNGKGGGKFIVNHAVRDHLKKFFETYQGKIIWHNANYDLKAIIYSLWMDDLLDMEGMLQGLDTMTRSFHDTKIIAYLATNSTAGNELGLKALAHEFAGNYAVEVKDITKVPLDALLEYNGIDGLSTWYVFNKYYPKMVDDRQEELYYELMLPSLKTIIQTELCGMPLNKHRVQEVKAELEGELKKHTDVLSNSPAVEQLNERLQREAMEAANAKLKTKQHPLSKFADVVFNPNSPTQCAKLLYDGLGLPIIDRTDTKQPATGAKTLAKLINHTDDPDVQDILEALINFSEIEKILSSFIPSFEAAIEKGDGDIVWLHGSFNLGGTVSGRLSSSDPNLQNLPANSTYGKVIKSCFEAPKGWIFVGADFNSLEDYVSALQTRDPNKLRVYEDGYDGHCLRAFYYFGDQMPEIEETPESINSIKKKYPELRQDSKGPTFLLTYGGTHHGLMTKLGWPKEKAQQIEDSYHELYKVSDAWVQARLDEAAKCGYIECAFGLRVRTPLLARTLRNHKSNPYEAKAEARTAGNALGQSYGLLTNRALNELMKQVWDSPYRYSIKPIGLIHDANYLLVKDDIDVLHWVNQRLIEAMRWQELPEIQHDTVKLGAELSVFWPTWKDELTLPNDIEPGEIRRLCLEHKKEQTE